MIFIRLKYIFLIIIFLNIFSINAYSYEINDSYKDKEIIKIAVYKNEPYFSIDDKGNVSGYYHDLINLLKERYYFESEYVLCDLSDGVKMLEDGTIDLMFGLSITTERKDTIVFNKYRISQEKHALLTKLNIKNGDLDSIDGLRLGVLKDSADTEWLLAFLVSKEINVTPIYDTNFDNLKNLLDNNEIDIMMGPSINNTDYNVIYNFNSPQVYIAANKNVKYILDNLDDAIEYFGSETNNKIHNLYESYFISSDDKDSKYNTLIFSNILLFLLTLLLIIPKLKLRAIRNRVKLNLNNNSYILYYQPIYNPRSGDIISFEGLLRLKDKDNNILPPSKFINEIENSNMLFDVTLWTLKQTVKDYKLLKKSAYFSDKDFYISINVSISEMENKGFVEKAIEIISDPEIGPNKICLEIIERVKINDLSKITKYITVLRNAGFKIAIDDFGVEYSNLDIIRKLDFDIIKIDKYFIDNICDDAFNKNIILFINTLATALNKSVVLEGVETIEQHNLIKNIDNEILYVQGYLYCKPKALNDILYTNYSIEN